MTKPDFDLISYRYADKVVLGSIDGSQYLSESEARKLARALYAAARSIRTEAFANSNVAPTHVSYAKL